MGHQQLPTASEDSRLVPKVWLFTSMELDGLNVIPEASALASWSKSKGCNCILPTCELSYGSDQVVHFLSQTEYAQHHSAH